MLKEIGSNFWLSQEPRKKAKIDCKMFCTAYEDEVLTSSGRSAISLVLSELKSKGKRVLLPSFTCESVIEPFLKSGYEVFYYSVDRQLNIRREVFREEIEASAPSVIFIHNYYGFDTTYEIRKIISNLRNQGIVIIEDITQVLYSDFPRLDADYFVGSFRKWSGIPDGGFALNANQKFLDKPVEEDTVLLSRKIDAMKAKYDYIFHGIGEKNRYLKLYAEAEELLENQTKLYKMSNVAVLEQANLDVDSLKAIRRRNFEGLLDGINNPQVMPLFNVMKENIVPLYFPILCKGKREQLQAYLREKNIYAPVVWPKPENIIDDVSEADTFYSNLLCIPCDQRYGVEEISYINKVINEY